MIHFGFVCPPVSGHLHPMSALGRELATQGHRVTFFQIPDLAPAVRAEGLGFSAIGARDHPVGSLPRSLADLSRLSGLAALRFTVNAVARTTAATCRDLPDAARAEHIEAFVVDQMEPAAGAVAEALGLPFVTVCNALPINRDPAIPPPFTPWRFRQGTWARWRNTAGYGVSDWLMRPVTQVVAEYRAAWKLPPLRVSDDSFSRLAQICQIPQAFDLPRRALPESFHYVGPIRSSGGVSSTRFAWDRLDGRPLVYASLGTLQNRRAPVFRHIIDACEGLGVQLIVSHGGGLSDEDAATLTANHAVIVPWAPQQAVLSRAALAITHAGLNTVMDALSCGVPVVAVPITYEQPAIARRVERTSTGLVVPFSRLSVERLRGAIRAVLGGEQYRRAAGTIRSAIAEAGGVQRAADLTVAAVTGRPASAARDSSHILTAAMNREAARPSQMA